MVYRTIQQNGEAEMIIKKSRFITHLARIQSEADAQAFIADIKKTHYKANHNVKPWEAPYAICGDAIIVKRYSV